MLNWISYGFFRLAIIMSLAHSLVPHMHEYSREVSITSQSNYAESEFGLLGKQFLLDIVGENHLENFLSIHQKTVNFSKKSILQILPMIT